MHCGKKLSALVLVALTGSMLSTASAQTQVTYRGTSNLATSTTDQNSTSFAVGGLSGITWLGGNSYVAVMDNSNKLVNINIQLNGSGTITSASITGGLSLPETRDFEGIAYTNFTRNSVFLSEEGTPAVREYSLADGSSLQSLTTPPVFTGANLRPNFGFESLTRSVGGTEMWTANEEALTVDGARSTDSVGSTVRLQRYTVSGNTATPAQQYAYVTRPVHTSHSDADFSTSRSGLSDLVELPNGNLIALERSFALQNPNVFSTFRNSLYEISLSGATDVSGLGSGLIGQSYTPVTKSLLFENVAGAFTGFPLFNLEGLTLGPQIGPDRYVMIGIADNQNSSSFSNTLVAFEVVTPEPASLSLLGGFATFMLRRVSRR